MRSAWSLVFVALGCTSADSTEPFPPGTQPPPGTLFGEAVRRVVLEVDYAAGAEPYTGSAAAMNDVWDLFEANASALFGGDKEVVVPHLLEEMEGIGTVDGEQFDSAAILALSAQHRDQTSAGDTATFHALWLDGAYAEDGEARPEVLGVSLGDTGVIAMFKPTIESSGLGPLDAISRYVEQATIVHEFGHAVGLVDNGLPLTSAHHDAEHGAHCTNEDCVMYFAIEGVGGAVDFAQKYITTGDAILFGNECLDDASAAR